MTLQKFLIISAAILASIAARGDDSLWSMFENPDDEARTKVWWFHGET